LGAHPVTERPESVIDVRERDLDDPRTRFWSGFNWELLAMSVRTVTRALVLAAVGSILSAALALADTITADGDLVAPGVQGTIDLGQVGPGQVIDLDVGFTLACGGTKHVNADQSVGLSFSAIVPAGGSAGGTNTSIAPPGDPWPDDGSDCTGAPSAATATTPAHVTITAPTATGTDYTYLLMWFRTLSPVESGDTGTFSGGTSVTVVLDVVNNSAPVLTVPSDMTVEGNTTAGAHVTFAVSTTDAEDDPDPTPTCSPASGSFFPLGVSTVSCGVTDSGGMSDNGSFTVTVVDTTDPVLSGVPGTANLDTSDPAGTTLTYAMPTASDVVDSNPSVDCVPGSGSQVPVGDTTVVCTAQDDSGNTAVASFDVHVTYHAPDQWSSIWDEPIGDGSALSTTGARTVPVKLRLFLNGNEMKTGTPMLVVQSCDGGTALASMTLEWGSGNGRWSTHLDTSHLAPGCYRVSAMVGDAMAGSFRLDIVGSTSAAETKRATTSSGATDGATAGPGKSDTAPNKGGSKKEH
jgi:hypothetical protein